jgi:DNA-binding transcriptional LysR family regulator
MNTIKLTPLLLIFAEVAKQQSYTQAAKKLNLSKSAISQQIKRLEESLELQLLARNTRGVKLTPVGEILLARSELLTEQIANAVHDINLVKAQPSGAFKVSVPPFFERNIVIPALQQLCLEFPLIKPELVVTGKWQDLIEHNLDAAIFGGNLKDSNYKAQSIGKVRDVFCASPNYIHQAGIPENLAALQQNKFIATPWQQGTLKLFDGAKNEECDINLSHFAQTNSVSTLVDMALGHMGIALIPEFIAHQELRRGHLLRVLPKIYGKAWHFYYLHRYQGNKPAHVQRFYQLIRHYFVNANCMA